MSSSSRSAGGGTSRRATIARPSGLAGDVGGAADADAALFVAPHDLQLDRQTVLGEDRRQGVRILEGLAGCLDEEVALADPGTRGRAAILDGPDEEPGAVAQANGGTKPTRDVGWSDRDAEPGPGNRFAAAEGVDALPQGRIRRPGEVEALADAVRVDRDDATLRVHEGAAGRAGCERGGVLDAAADLCPAGAAERALDAGHETGRHAGGAVAAGRQAEDDVADRGIGVREAERRGARRVDVDDREVPVTVDAADLADGRTAITEGDGDLVAAEIVGIGQDAAVGDDNAAAADSAADPDDARGGGVGDGADRGGELFEGGHDTEDPPWIEPDPCSSGGDRPVRPGPLSVASRNILLSNPARKGHRVRSNP